MRDIFALMMIESRGNVLITFFADDAPCANMCKDDSIWKVVDKQKRRKIATEE